MFCLVQNNPTSCPKLPHYKKRWGYFGPHDGALKSCVKAYYKVVFEMALKTWGEQKLLLEEKKSRKKSGAIMDANIRHSFNPVYHMIWDLSLWTVITLHHDNTMQSLIRVPLWLFIQKMDLSKMTPLCPKWPLSNITPPHPSLSVSPQTNRFGLVTEFWHWC